MLNFSRHRKDTVIGKEKDMTLSKFIETVKHKAENPHSIFPAIYEEILRQEAMPSFRHRDVWHPSSMHNFCPLGAVASRIRKDLCEKKMWSAEELLNFWKGKVIHTMFQEQFLGPAQVLYGTWRCNQCGAEPYAHPHVLSKGTRVTGRKVKSVKGNAKSQVVTLEEGGTGAFESMGTMPTEPCTVCQHIPDGTIGNILMRKNRCKIYCGNDVNKDVRDDYKVKERGDCNHCGEWGQWEYREVRAKDEVLNISGSSDGIVKVEDGVPRVLELKTANVFMLKKFEEGPWPSHYTQVQIYMHCKDMEDGLIVAVNKDFAKNVEHKVSIDIPFLTALFDKVREANEFLYKVMTAKSKKDLPKAKDLTRICAKKAEGVKKYCPYVDACFDKEDVLGRVKERWAV